MKLSRNLIKAVTFSLCALAACSANASNKYKVSVLDEKPFIYDVEDPKYVDVKSQNKTNENQPVVVLSMHGKHMMYTINTQVIDANNKSQSVSCTRIDKIEDETALIRMPFEVGERKIGDKIIFNLHKDCMQDTKVVDARSFITIERIE